ncbi:MAG: hypothetical protein DRQ51_10810 [Gammaproteobacteria bacterium]|nr:MAG: hypothetical protein DRQ51_10810 [Gammaproteobacteria bacterium]
MVISCGQTDTKRDCHTRKLARNDGGFFWVCFRHAKLVISQSHRMKTNPKNRTQKIAISLAIIRILREIATLAVAAMTGVLFGFGCTM